MTSARGHYGANHRGSIIKAGDLDGTYTVSIPSLAPGLAWGPIPALIPGLVSGDPVLVCQLGTTQSELVIVGKIPGTLPGFADIPGLSAALAAKADEADLTTTQGEITALDTRLTGDETTIGANGTAITALSTRMTSAETRLTTDETTLTSHAATLTLLTAERDYSHGNDVEISHDYLSTMARALVTSSITLTGGHGYYVKMRTHRAVNLNVIKTCLAVAGAGGTLKIAAYAGPDTSALIYQGTANLSLAVGRQDWSLSSPVALAAGDYLVVGILATGMSAAPSLSCSPSVSTTLLNQDATVLTAVSTTASTLTALPTSALNLATLTGYNLLGQIPWLAASP